MALDRTLKMSVLADGNRVRSGPHGRCRWEILEIGWYPGPGQVPTVATINTYLALFPNSRTLVLFLVDRHLVLFTGFLYRGFFWYFRGLGSLDIDSI